MNKFSWYEASSVEDALSQVSSTVSETLQPNASDNAAVIKSGGTDMLDLIKEGLSRPGKVVNIRNIQGLDKISYDSKKGLTLGPNVTLAELEADSGIKENYLALHQAVSHAATPQLRNMATIGGNLAQRTRCWYFRSIDHECFRKGSGICFAREGENEFHAIIKNGACASVHSSSVSTALLAFGCTIEITNKKGEKNIVPMSEFFVLPGDDSRKENILEANEMITSINVPAPGKKVKSYYEKQGARESYDWPIADVAVVMELSGANCKKATVVLGAAAPVPIVSKSAGDALSGATINESTASQAAKSAMKGATPLEHNGYKLPIFEAIIKRAILKTV